MGERIMRLKVMVYHVQLIYKIGHVLVEFGILQGYLVVMELLQSKRLERIKFILLINVIQKKHT